MKIPDSQCESCSRGKRCTSKSDVCKKFWDWFKPAWAEAVRPLRAVKLKKAAYRQCMRAHCQWANADGICTTQCMEPEKRDYVADTQSSCVRGVSCTDARPAEGRKEGSG